jgi:hypothetical protein
MATKTKQQEKINTKAVILSASETNEIEKTFSEARDFRSI